MKRTTNNKAPSTHQHESQATQTESNSCTYVEDSNCYSEFVKVNDSGEFNEGGDVCRVNGADVFAGVTHLFKNGTASGNLIVGNTLIPDVSITAQISWDCVISQ